MGNLCLTSHTYESSVVMRSSLEDTYVIFPWRNRLMIVFHLPAMLVSAGGSLLKAESQRRQAKHFVKTQDDSLLLSA